jgi:hypothetical protein
VSVRYITMKKVTDDVKKQLSQSAMLPERWSFSENGRRVKCKLPLTLVRALLLLCLVLDFANARSPGGRWDVYLTHGGIGYRTAKTQVVVSDEDVVEQAYNYKV